MIKKIYFDMDDVLVDFTGSIKKLGYIKEDEYVHNFQWMYDKVDEGSFFDVMDPNPYLDSFLSMMDRIKSLYGPYSVAILSSLGGADMASTGKKIAEQKIQWLEEHVFPKVSINDINFVPYASKKAEYVGPGRWLIDDQKRNVDSFNYNGNNHGILYSMDTHNEDIDMLMRVVLFGKKTI